MTPGPRSATALEGAPRWATHPPHPTLAALVSAYWSLELDGPRHAVRSLPDACVDVVFDLSARTARAFVAAPQRRARTWQRSGRVRLVAARLWPGAAGLVAVSPGALPEGWTPLEAFLPATALSGVLDELAEAPDLPRRLAALDRFFLERSLLLGPVDRRLLYAIKGLLEAGEAPRVGALAAQLGVSPRTLRRRFVAQVGLPPKRFARIARFQAVLRRLKTAALPDEDLGYFDQAHFIRELKELFGATPGEARRLLAQTR